MSIAYVAIAFALMLGVPEFGVSDPLAAVAFASGVLVATAALHLGVLYRFGAHRWRLRVTQAYGAKVTIEAKRLWETVELDEIKTKGEDFDERLHEAVAKGQIKVAALNAQRAALR